MSDPYYLALWIGLGALGVGIAWTAISFPLAVLVGRMFARAEDEAVEMVPDETPIYTATIAHVVMHDAADIDAQWSLLWDVIS